MRKNHILLIICICLVSCRNHDGVPKDFGFRIEDEVEIINSFDSSYVRKYIDNSNGRPAIEKRNLIFSKEEFTSIYNDFLQNRLNWLPETFKPNCISLSDPSFNTKMNFKINGKSFEVLYNSDCEEDYLKFLLRYRITRVEKSIRNIRSIVYLKKEVKSLEPTNLLFK